MRRRIIWGISAVCVIILCVFSITTKAVDSEEKEYVYDDNGRIAEVIYSNGDKEIYTYDENGNILSVKYVSDVQDTLDDSSATDDTTSGGTSENDTSVAKENDNSESAGDGTDGAMGNDPCDVPNNGLDIINDNGVETNEVAINNDGIIDSSGENIINEASNSTDGKTDVIEDASDTDGDKTQGGSEGKNPSDDRKGNYITYTLGILVVLVAIAGVSILFILWRRKKSKDKGD